MIDRSMRLTGTVERVLSVVRTGTAALALALALLLLLRIPLLATFKAALIVLAALEVLAFGRRVLSADARAIAWVEIVVKVTVLGAAYVVLGS